MPMIHKASGPVQFRINLVILVKFSRIRKNLVEFSSILLKFSKFSKSAIRGIIIP